LQELEAFPEGTVGKAYADHMISKNLDPYFYLLATEHKISPKIDYFRQRVFQSHDLWHVLTGFTTEVDDEAALQAFTLAQVRGPFSALVVCLAILHFVRYRVVDLMKVVDKVVWGWYLGKTSRLLLSVPFEQIMRRPLKEVQAEYLPALSRKTEYAQQAALQL
ncbi:MAG: Coq4 family protein, partial [Bdellovibrionales bacterium]